jgi:Asp/Glu/hydantoin racemase
MSDLLLINPNTNEAITELIRRQAEAVAPPDHKIRTVTAPFGAESLETPAETVIAAHAVLTALARCYRAGDVAITAAFSDPGLRAARQLVDIPVVGMAEAAIQDAARGGRRFTIITLGPGMRETILDQVRSYGCIGGLAGLRFLEGTVLQLTHSREAFVDSICNLAARAIDEDGAEAIVLGGSPFSGMAGDTEERLRIPTFDGIAPAVRRAAELASQRRPAVASPAAPGRRGTKRYLGLDPALAELLSAKEGHER